MLAAQGKQGEAATALGSERVEAGGDPHRALDLGTMYVNAGNYAAAEEELRFAVKGLPQTAKPTMR